MKTMFLAVGLVITPAAFSQDRGGIPIAENAKFAWHENVGYINFADAGEPVGSQAVRVGGTFLSGFAWGENIGWLNLDDTEVFVGLRCVADWDGDGAVGPADVVMYAMEADGGLGFTDLDDDGDIDAFDLILLLEISDRTCP